MRRCERWSVTRFLTEVTPACGRSWEAVRADCRSDPADAEVLAVLDRVVADGGFDEPILVRAADDEDRADAHQPITTPYVLCDGTHRFLACWDAGAPVPVTFDEGPADGATMVVRYRHHLTDRDAADAAETATFDWLRSFPLPGGGWVNAIAGVARDHGGAVVGSIWLWVTGGDLNQVTAGVRRRLGAAVDAGCLDLGQVTVLTVRYDDDVNDPDTDADVAAGTGWPRWTVDHIWTVAPGTGRGGPGRRHDEAGSGTRSAGPTGGGGVDGSA
jgi:hypothetical protein